ncbi:urease accessory protein UreD [Paenibacillus sacheonensis]|uniref:Urease accessory protein UreD n=1 Tax=Paenibacillus sacheonensis TaxID=742054 RepID=A0A7X4YNF2_9BACL|nr:urease accessory protein UreD [Paenibacillus sacheonensis]NBC69592.1 urease accessory protein UreD [Paenibacillus sacheonensis]
MKMLPSTATPSGQRLSVLRTTFRKRENDTVIVSKYHTAPIKIAKTFPLGDQLGVIVMDVSPGLLAGDRYELRWNVEAGAHVYVTNQSFTKVHPSHGDHDRSSLSQHFELGRGAVVESMPEPIMLFRDAALVSETEVRLSPDSIWMGAEVFCPGRTMRGERFVYREFRNKLHVYYGDEMIYAQNQLIKPSGQRLSAPGCMADMTHTGVFYAFSDRIGIGEADAVREALGALPATEGQPLTWGVSLTYKHGLAVMAAGMSAWQLQETLDAAWRALRMKLLQMKPLKFLN